MSLRDVLADLLYYNLIVGIIEFTFDWYPWYEPTYPPSFELKSATTRMALVLDNPQKFICH